MLKQKKNTLLSMLVNAPFLSVVVTLLHLNCEKEKKEQKVPVLKERKEGEDSFCLFFHHVAILPYFFLSLPFLPFLRTISDQP